MKAMQWSRAFALAGGLTALVWGTAVGPAAAAPLEREHFHDSFSEVFEEFCGDLTVRHDVEVDGTFLFNFHGPDGLGYALETFHGTESFTNLANDKTITHVFNTVSKDLKVTDNGDGTLTILVLATGSDKIFGPDGEFLFNDPGQTRFEILIDHGGTPTDPSDDEFLEDLGVVKGSTGRNDLEGRDFCDDIHEFIG
jgi:hypothetical protein